MTSKDALGCINSTGDFFLSVRDILLNSLLDHCTIIGLANCITWGEWLVKTYY